MTMIAMYSMKIDPKKIHAKKKNMICWSAGHECPIPEEVWYTK